MRDSPDTLPKADYELARGSGIGSHGRNRTAHTGALEPASSEGTQSAPHDGRPAPDLAGALDALATGVAIIASDGGITYANESLIGVFGASASERNADSFWDLLPEGVQAPEAEMILSTARDGAGRSCCSRVKQLELEIRAERLSRDAILVEICDATARARVERRLEQLLESITDGLCLLDSRWHLTYWNAAAERMTGLSSADVVGLSVSVAFGNMLGSQLASRFIETLRRNSPTEIRSWTYAGDSKGRAAGTYDAFIYPVDTGGAVVIFREVGERVRAEREIAERRDDAEALHALVKTIAEVSDSSELRRLLAQSAMERSNARGSAVIEVEGPDGVITAAAGESLQLVGMRVLLAGSLTERAIRDRGVIDVADYSSEYPEHHRRMLGQVMGPALAISLVAHDITLAVLIVSRSPHAERFTARDSERLRILADHAALGLWKLRLLDQAHAANRAKSDFMATMSHELRTPLAALAGYGEILAEEVAGPLSAVQLDVVERMRSVTNHLAVLIDEILTYSSLESGSESASFTEVNLADVLRAAVAVVEPIALQKSISLACESGEGIRIATDPDKLRQILVHILGNAIKFTEHGGVNIEARVVADWLQVKVEDTGIGIAEEHRTLLFQPFSQLDAGLRRRHKGAGLGLFISQRLARLLGGSIDFESTVGQGSSFTLRIPLNSPVAA